MKLHTYGLLNNSFQLTSQIRVVWTYWRQRAEHVRAAASCIQRMQKALTQMNVQLANVISDLSGVTGQLIVRAKGGEVAATHKDGYSRRSVLACSCADLAEIEPKANRS